MITGSALISLLITVIIVGLTFWLLMWAIGSIGIPEPFNKVARVIVILAAVLYLLDVLLGLGGHPLVRW